MEKQIIIASKYQVIRKIGEGGTAKVYLAYDTIYERNVALKILKKENVNEKKIRHFQREANALSMMDDDNIVKIYEVGEEGQIHYIATEFIEGMTLKEYIVTCSPLPIEEILEITNQVLVGLMHAHDKKVVHKDIKSQNILLDKDKNVKITDFGIANVIDDDATKTQSLMGTPQYIAPEILTREQLTAQSDLYSVGILMFEMLVGKAPFTGEAPAIIMVKQINHPLPSIIMERADVPQSLENIVIKATAKKLYNRYKTAEEINSDLKICLGEAKRNEEKLVLQNDFFSDDLIEKTISLNEDINYIKLKSESDKLEQNKKKKNVILASVVSFFLLISVLFLFLYEGESLMPDLLDKPEGEIASLLTLQGINIENVSFAYEPSDYISESNVVSTNPKAGEKINKNEKIIVTISTGVEAKVIKDFTNSLGTIAKDELETLGFTNIILKEIESKKAIGVIVSQSIPPGTSVAFDDEIIFEISNGTYELVVPNFKDLEKAEVRAWTEENGVNLTFSYLCNNQYEEGRIFEQVPKYGTTIKNGDIIEIKISDGNCEDEIIQPNDPNDPDATKPEGT